MSVPSSQVILPSPLLYGNCNFVFTSVTYFCFVNNFICTFFFFQIPYISDILGRKNLPSTNLIPVIGVKDAN